LNRRNLIKFASATAAALAIPTTRASAQATVEPSITPVPYSPIFPPDSLSGEIIADGSSTVGPITEAVAEEFQYLAPDIQIINDISGTGGGFKRFCAGETDIQNASRHIKDEEIEICKENGVNYLEFEVAYDGVTLVTSKDNDWLTCLTVEQLNELWKSDSTISRWNQLDPSFPDEAVVLYGPGTDSGTFDYFTEEICGEKGNSRSDYSPSEDDNVTVVGVSSDTTALGYLGYAYYLENEDTLNVVAVNNGSGCVVPSVDTIRDQTYAPLSRPLFVYANTESLTRPEVAEFMNFYISTVSDIIEDVGYVASPDEVIAQDQIILMEEITN